MAIQGGFGLSAKIMVGTVLTAIVHIIDGEIPEFERDLAEVTAHDSTSGYAEWIATGKRKVNSFKLTLAWDDSSPTHLAMVTNFASATSVSMSIQDPAGNEIIAFSAFIQKMSRISKQDDAFTCEVTIQPTGVATIT